MMLCLWWPKAWFQVPAGNSPETKWMPASPRMWATVLGGMVAGHQADYCFPASSGCSRCLWLLHSTAGVRVWCSSRSQPSGWASGHPELPSQWWEYKEVKDTQERTPLTSRMGVVTQVGRDVNLPIEVALGTNPPNREHNCYCDYVENLKETMLQVHGIARSHLQRCMERHDRNYDTRMATATYTVGDLVYYIEETKTFGKSPKLWKKWMGPCVVVKNKNKTKLSGLI